MALTAKQAAFIDEYLKDFNATQAAIRSGYSPKTAYSIGQQNLKKVEIDAEIQRLIKERVMSRDEALKRLADIARFDVSPYVNSYGRLTGIDVNKLIDDGYGHLIRSIKQTPSGTVIEWADPSAALQTVIKETHPTGHEDDPTHVKVVIKYDDTHTDAT